MPFWPCSEGVDCEEDSSYALSPPTSKPSYLEQALRSERAQIVGGISFFIFILVEFITVK